MPISLPVVSRGVSWAVGAVVGALAVVAILSVPLSVQADKAVRPGGLMLGLWKKSAAATVSSPVTFSFHREEVGAGHIFLQLGPDGDRFVGTYLRLTGDRPQSRVRIYHTYWISDEFDDFRFGPGGAPLNRRSITVEQFQSRYSGSVVANLTSAAGGGIRCLFKLLDPNGGLAGGATGRCQVNDGGIVDLVQQQLE